jgi:hypothetical protein
MNIIDRVKSLFQRRPLSEQELAARAEAQAMQVQLAADLAAAEQRMEH